MKKDISKKSQRRLFFIFVFICILILIAGGFALIEPVQYIKASNMLASGEYDGAKAIFQTISYADSGARVSDCDFEKAGALLEQANYAQAKAIFQSLGDYAGAAESVIECDYRSAKASLDSGDAAAAMHAFAAIREYKDSADLEVQARELLYQQALASERACEFSTALAFFEELGEYNDSKLQAKYCQRRINAQQQGSASYISDSALRMQLPDGKLYSCNLGAIYIPDECTADTKALIYFPGGDGQVMLNFEAMQRYLENFSPDAVMLFHYASGYREMANYCEQSLDIMESIAIECGISLHNMCITASSNGTFTAFKVILYFYENGYITTETAFMLDPGLDWEQPEDYLLDAEQCKLLSEIGTKLFLFEQGGVGLNRAPIKLMVEQGVDVSMVECANDDHERITSDAFRRGLFSWAMGEYAELNPEEYTLIKLEPEPDSLEAE